MKMQKIQPHLTVLGSVLLALCTSSQAQIKTIPKEGLPGLSKEAVEFEIEHNYRRENNLGQTVPAEEGTPPNSKDPRVFEGTWVTGRTYNVNADGTYSEGGMMPPGAGMGAAGPGGAPGGAAGGAPGGAPPAGGPPGGGGQQSGPSCGISFSFGAAMPSKIVQTDKVIYFFNTAGTTRRIEMTDKFPASMTPRAMGYSIGHWEDGTLVVQSQGFKAAAGRGGAGGPPGMGGGASLGANSKVTERMKKIEGGLKLENLVTIEDTATGQTTKQRVVSFYRPDLQFVEAPCEEYSDPFAGGAYNDPAESAKVIETITKQSGK